METAVILAITELLKMGVMFLVSNAKQAGLNDQQINTAFNEAMNKMLLNDPNKIPD